MSLPISSSVTSSFLQSFNLGTDWMDTVAGFAIIPLVSAFIAHQQTSEQMNEDPKLFWSKYIVTKINILPAGATAATVSFLAWGFFRKNAHAAFEAGILAQTTVFLTLGAVVGQAAARYGYPTDEMKTFFTNFYAPYRERNRATVFLAIVAPLLGYCCSKTLFSFESKNIVIQKIWNQYTAVPLLLFGASEAFLLAGRITKNASCQKYSITLAQASAFALCGTLLAYASKQTI